MSQIGRKPINIPDGVNINNDANNISVKGKLGSLEHQFIYSSRIKEVARLGATIDNLVPTHIANAIKERL